MQAKKDAVILSSTADDVGTLQSLPPGGPLTTELTDSTRSFAGLVVDANGDFIVRGTVQDVGGAHVTKYTRDFKRAWTNTEESTWLAAIAVGPDGAVYAAHSSFSFGQSTLRKISTDGVEVWATSVGSYMNDVIVDEAGFSYTASNDNTVRKWDSSGAEVWRYTGHSSNVWGLAFDHEGYLLSYGADSSVAKIDPTTGQALWRTSLSHSTRAISLDGAGNVYVSSAQGLITSLAGATGAVRWVFDDYEYTDTWMFAWALGGYVYVGVRDGVGLLQLTTDGGLTGRSWPIEASNMHQSLSGELVVTNTGRASAPGYVLIMFRSNGDVLYTLESGPFISGRVDGTALVAIDPFWMNYINTREVGL